MRKATMAEIGNELELLVVLAEDGINNATMACELRKLKTRVC